MLSITAIIYICIYISVTSSTSHLSHGKNVFCIDTSLFAMKPDEHLASLCSHIILNGFCIDPYSYEMKELGQRNISVEMGDKLLQLKSNKLTKELKTIIPLSLCLHHDIRIKNASEHPENKLIDFLMEYNLNGMYISEYVRETLNLSSRHDDLYESFKNAGLLLIIDDLNCFRRTDYVMKADFFLSYCYDHSLDEIDCSTDKPSEIYEDHKNTYVIDKRTIIFDMFFTEQSKGDFYSSTPTYEDICKKIISQNLNVTSTENCAKQTIDVSGKKIIFNDPETIVRKASYIISNGYNSISIIDQYNDDISGVCSKSNRFEFPYGITGKRPLLQAVNLGITNTVGFTKRSELDNEENKISESDYFEESDLLIFSSAVMIIIHVMI